MYTIYALVDEANVIRYIGFTSKPIQKRLEGHIRDARQHEKYPKLQSAKEMWIISERYNIDIKILKTVETEADARHWEKEYIVSFKDTLELCNTINNVTLGRMPNVGISLASKSKICPEADSTPIPRGVPRPTY